MYKKIILIALSCLIKNSFTRCTYMMLVIFIFTWFTARSRPYLLTNMNYLEYHANFCALLIIITSAFYIENNNEILQTTFLILIIYMNISFWFKWVLAMTKIILIKYETLVYKICPHLYVFLLSLINYVDYPVTDEKNHKVRFWKRLQFMIYDYQVLARQHSLDRVKTSVHYTTLLLDFQNISAVKIRTLMTKSIKL